MKVLHRITTCLLFILTLGAIVQPISSQNTEPSISWSENHIVRLISTYDKVEYIKSDGNYFYFCVQTPNGMPISGVPPLYEVLVKYNKSEDKINTLNLKLETENKLRKRLAVTTIGNEIHIISSFKNKEQNIEYIFDETVNQETMTLNNDIKKVAEINCNNNKSMKLNDVIVRVKKENLNGEEMVSLIYFGSKDYGVILLNSKFETTAKYEPALDDYKYIDGYMIDNGYNLYVFERDATKKFKYINSTLQLVCHPFDGSPSIKKDISIENQFITKQKMVLNNKNQIVCVGLYSDKNIEMTLGAFNCIFEPKLQNDAVIQKVPFDLPFLTKGMNEKDVEILTKQQKKNEIDYFYEIIDNINSIHFDNDGGFTMIADKYRRDISSNVGMSFSSNGTISMNSSKQSAHLFGDIFVLSFDASGILKWKTKIYRNEDFFVEMNGSYFVQKGDNNSFNFLYTKFNNENKAAGKYYISINGTAFYTTIDANGTVTTDKVLNIDKKSILDIIPRATLKLDENKYMILKVSKSSQINFGEISIK